MEKLDVKIAELTYLFRTVQLIHEVDSVDKIYRMLLSFATCGSVIGCETAMIFTLDRRNRVIRGRMGLDHATTHIAASRQLMSFADMARQVFDGFEMVESSDLTLLARTFSVPLEWHRSALVKAARTNYPVLAEGRLSEYSTDPFFEFFGTDSYIALPIRGDGLYGGGHEKTSGDAVSSVLAACGSKEKGRLDVEMISLLYSLAQQASLAINNLKGFAECDRRFRILSKIDESLMSADSQEKIVEAVKLAMTMVCRDMQGTGCIIKNLVTGKTLYVKAAHEYSLNSEGRDIAIADCFEAILDRAAGTIELINGDASYPLLREEAAVARFLACPLSVQSEVIGALAVYVEKDALTESDGAFTERDSAFLELIAGFLASALNAKEMESRLQRNEDFLEEVRSNLTRERDRSRMGERGIVYSEKIKEEIARMKSLLLQESKASPIFPRIQTILADVEKHTDIYLQEASSIGSNLRSINLFRLIDAIAREWKQKMEANGINVSLKIPSPGPRLLMDKGNIALAVRNILESIGTSLSKDDKALIECSVDKDKILILFADTGAGMPGDLLSRLFMPFHGVEFEDERKNALSLAGEIISLHGGEIIMKTSLNWRTIFILRFRRATNRDRRKGIRDRRQRIRDRRIALKKH